MTFEADIQRCLKTLGEGGVILYPTDTIWGLGSDATQAAAVEKIFSIKQRAEAKSLIVLVCDEDMLNRFVRNIPALAWDLMELSEKPVTIIYDQPKGLAKNVLAEDGSAGIRLVRDEFCKRLIQKFRKPIVSTSANLSGEPSPGSFYDIGPEIKSKADYVVKWKQDDLAKNQPSSVIKLKANGEIKIIRK